MLTKLTDATTITVREDVFGMRACTEFAPGILEGTKFFIVAETPDGFRFEHSHTFCTGTKEANEDGFESWFQDRAADAATASAFADRVQAHINAGGSLGPDFWSPIQGAYCSAAWDSQAETERERREEESFC